jgi:hypothetical protein
MAALRLLAIGQAITRRHALPWNVGDALCFPENPSATGIEAVRPQESENPQDVADGLAVGVRFPGVVTLQAQWHRFRLAVARSVAREPPRSGQR